MRFVGYRANGFRPDNPNVQAMLRDSAERKALFGQYYCPFLWLESAATVKDDLVDPCMAFTYMYACCIAYAIALVNAQISQTRSGSCRALSKDIRCLVILLLRMDTSRTQVYIFQL